jgi:hypothetical protein
MGDNSVSSPAQSLPPPVDPRPTVLAQAAVPVFASGGAGIGKGAAVIQAAPVPKAGLGDPVQNAFAKVRDAGQAIVRMNALAAGGFSNRKQFDRAYSDFRAACKDLNAAIDKQATSLYGAAILNTPAMTAIRHNAYMGLAADTDVDGKLFATAAELIGPLETAPKLGPDEGPRRPFIMANAALTGLHDAAWDLSREKAANLVILVTPSLMVFMEKFGTVFLDEDKARIKNLELKIAGFSPQAVEAIAQLQSAIGMGP